MIKNASFTTHALIAILGVGISAAAPAQAQNQAHSKAKTKAQPSASGTTQKYSDCNRYNEFGFSSGNGDEKKQANYILDGAVYRESIDPLPSSEIAARDWCVSQALAHGADPNNTQSYQAPLINAVSNSDDAAALALLKYKANPNAASEGLGVSNRSIPVLLTACEYADDTIVLALLEAGADPVPGEPLWMAASMADDIAVQALLNTGKIPVNQLSQFGSDPAQAQTALDASEARLDALSTYFKVNQGKSNADKVDYANSVFIRSYYLGYPTIKAGTDVDKYVQKLQIKQQNVSAILKSKGWSCHEDNCGIIVDTPSPTDDSDSTPPTPDSPNGEKDSQ